MRIRRGRTGVDVLHEATDRWYDTGGADDVPTTVVEFLAGGERVRDAARTAIERAVSDGAPSTERTASTAFEPRSLRCFAGWEKHWNQAAETLVRHNLPAVVPLAKAYRAVTRKTFPPMAPGPEFGRHPVYYTGNHLSIVGDGDPMPWPHYTEKLDFELEFAAIVASPVRDASVAEAEAALGGFVVFDDFSARDTQWVEQRQGLFGPVIKTKTFASSMSAEVVTADEILPLLDDLGGTVTVNGEVWSSTSTAGARWSIAEALAYASRGESVGPGEVLSSGTLPSGCGLELDRWIQPGDRVTLSIDRIGSVTNTVAKRA
ncbi:fumarylacetoacetate hydrolase family protein [Rhodococcoides kroppenstedtii]|uniref:fumarylacetoacetate hydrolase family protein n=1 Tax=Rhodococcoides kroppenstedtii TaxID=293050 RepID=UPI003624BB17